MKEEVYTWVGRQKSSSSEEDIIIEKGSTCMIISFMSRDDGVSSKDLSNDKIGRDPLRQLPVKFNSSLTISFAIPSLENTLYALSSVHSPLIRGYSFVNVTSLKVHWEPSTTTDINPVHVFSTRKTTHYYNCIDPPIRLNGTI